jgi:hypothetical protein
LNDRHLFWGDIHNHCGISYGYGSLENALATAREQLDFCSITGHATWHDMPRGRKGVEPVADYHEKGFAKLARIWDSVCQTVEAANLPHEFITFHSYEAHSNQYGDYHILSPSPDLPILEAASPSESVAGLAPRPVIAIPHHVAYVPGYRGINWQAFSSAISPVVEVFSKHGCGMSDDSAYPYLDPMGPRDSRNTVRAGMRLGHQFGFVASTDHHAGYPGSYGDGRLAIWAEDKTRTAIWEAILARRTYAVTGDKIACSFCINGATMGREIHEAGPRLIELDIAGCDQLDQIVIYKNARPWQVVCGSSLISSHTASRFKVRVEMGWGRGLDGFAWSGELRVQAGILRSVEACFRGKGILEQHLGQAEDPDINGLDNKILEQTGTGAAWKCTTFKNISTLHPQTAALIFEIEGDPQTVLQLQLNGKQSRHSIKDVLSGSRGMHLQVYASEAFLVHRAVPETNYCFNGQWNDPARETFCDTYDVEIRQANGQYAWLSPIFVIS